MRHRPLLLAALALGLGLLGAAGGCGGSDDDKGDPAAATSKRTAGRSSMDQTRLKMMSQARK